MALNLSEDVHFRSETGQKKVFRRDDGRRPGLASYLIAMAAFAAFLPAGFLVALSAPLAWVIHRGIDRALADTPDKGAVLRLGFWVIAAWVRLYVRAFHALRRLLPGPIMQGDLAEIWKRYHISPEERPELHMKDIPVDVRQALWADGKTITGELPASLGDSEITARSLHDMALITLKHGLAVFGTILGVWFVGLASNGRSPLDLLGVAPFAALVGLNAGILMSMDAVRYGLGKLRAYAGVATRDLKRYERRPEVVAAASRVNRIMAENAAGYFRADPVLTWGVADGTARSRGDISAPLQGQPLATDMQSLYKHVLGLGATGEGKSTFIFSLLSRWWLSIPGTSALVLDDKAALWRDITGFAASVGREDDMRVIGVEKGQYHVDLLNGLDPASAVTLIEACLPKEGGGGSDPFWETSSLSLLRHYLVLARAYEATPEGIAFVRKTGDRIYSFGWVYSVHQDEEKLVEALRSITDLYIDEPGLAAAIDCKELRDSVTYLSTTIVGSEGNKTVESVKAVLTSYLNSLCGQAALRRFAWASSGDCIDIQAAFDQKIVCVALSQLEYGSGARLASMLIKASFYRTARLREMRLKSKYCQAHPTLLLIDEAQALLSVGGNGLDDLQFPAVARSTGVVIAIATQSVSSLYARLGKENTEAVLQNLRTKIVMRTENPETLEYIRRVAGKQLRAEPGRGPESIDDRIRRLGFRPFAGYWTRSLWSGSRSPFASVFGFLAPLSLLNVPARGSISGGYGGSYALRVLEGFGVDFHVPSKQAAESHDISQRSVEEMIELQGGKEGSHGEHKVDMQDLLQESDITSMGQYGAIVIAQRCGASRMDRIAVVHRYA